jgi:NADPH:quinone reductase-like Zn-dependent oxidoreductase
MHAAVVTDFDTPPTYQDFAVPVPQDPDEVLVDVLAVGLHPRVRSQANGSHYTSSDKLPLVPGIDGVGRGPDGTLRYFVLPDTSMGAMAEQTVVDLRRSVVLPEDSDPVLIAAAMNPAMSSWLALRQRIDFTAGQRVLVLGATGNAGRMAIQVAKHLGASHVIGAGRQPAKLAALAALGADATVSLDGAEADGAGADAAQRLGQAACDVDVVLDYLWGQPAADAIQAVVMDRTDRGKPLAWIQIGSVAGPTAAVPSAALRAARLQIVGSGQGGKLGQDGAGRHRALAAAITAGTFQVDARTVPLADIETAWKDTGSSQRIVITPSM